ncbi:hypothetical protein PSAR109036_00270 [Psychrobacter arenosus]|uniref:hypothetical protein n=1 Tax=Psychrobacter arenosus TaxID=256326 RepID=UPI001917DD20|nr:hypothetical protein [Psychrobacter arenosus]
MKRHIPSSTLTLLAAATLTVMSVGSVQAATPAGPDAVPSAIDSSKRVIRAVNSSTQAPSAAQTGNSATAPQVLPNTATAPSAPSTPTAPMSKAEPEPKLDVRVYQNPQVDLSSSGVDLRQGQLSNIPTPTASVSAVSFVDTVLIPQTRDGASGQLDVSLLDDFLTEVAPNVRHYPPNFPNRSQRYNTREKIKGFVDWIEQYATAPNASYEVLLRAAKLNGMARNLDLGSDYAIRASTYVAKAIDRQPNSAEANFLYGMMLTEGGGFKEGKKYLDKAVSLGYTEAEQSLAQSDLLSDRRDEALNRLRQLQQRMPNDKMIAQQVKLVEDGKYYIWDIPAPDINVKP